MSADPATTLIEGFLRKLEAKVLSLDGDVERSDAENASLTRAIEEAEKRLTEGFELRYLACN